MLLSRLTALQKSDRKVPGVAAGFTFRRLVVKVMARQFHEVFRTAVAPAAFGLCDRSGTDARAHLLRAASKENPNIAITCVDVVGDFNHVLRSRNFGELPGAPPMLVPLLGDPRGAVAAFWPPAPGGGAPQCIHSAAGRGRDFERWWPRCSSDRKESR
jgi:hypothetical protein